MDSGELAKEIAVILSAPAVVLIGAAGVAAFVFWLVDWAYKLRKDGLNDQIGARTAQRDFANDRLAQSIQQIDELRKKLEEAEKTPARLGSTAGEEAFSTSAILRDLAQIRQANTATLGVSGGSYNLYAAPELPYSVPPKPRDKS